MRDQHQRRHHPAQKSDCPCQPIEPLLLAFVFCNRHFAFVRTLVSVPHPRWRVMVVQHYKAIANERKYPNIVELAVPTDGLQIELSRRIIQFHKSRHIQPRYGRQIVKDEARRIAVNIAKLPPCCESAFELFSE